MAYEIKDKKIINLVNTKEGRQLIIDFITRDGKEACIIDKSDGFYIKSDNYSTSDIENYIWKRSSGYTVPIILSDQRIVINPMSTKPPVNGMGPNHNNCIEEMYDYILYEVPVLLREKELDKLI